MFQASERSSVLLDRLWDIVRVVPTSWDPTIRLQATPGSRCCFKTKVSGPACLSRTFEPMHTMIRLFIALLGLGVAVFLGWTAYACWAVSISWGRRDLDLLGVSVPFSIGMVLLVGLALLFALGAVYAFFYPNTKN